MKTKLTFVILAFVFASIITLPAARADEHDQATQITFNQAVQIPGRVLPAGTYWFVVMDSPSDRDIVQIFNFDRSAIEATILTVSAERLEPVGRTLITFAEAGAMQPAPIVTWFYPGRTIGHQFLYSKPQEQELARAKGHTVTASAGETSQTAVPGD